MNVLDLFSGIGGFSLGLERAGMKTVAFCEIEPFPQSVLRKNFPGVPIYDDVRTLTAERLRTDGIPAVDLICGGFPCQDISVAGKGAGIREGTRSGLWFEYRRIIRELLPRLILVENVSALLNRGLDTVLGDLAEIGYDAEWYCIQAADVGLPHYRDRVWILAYPASSRQTTLHAEIALACKKSARENRKRFQLRGTRSGGIRWIPNGIVCTSPNGISCGLDGLAAAGNAVTPLIPEIIGKVIMNSMGFAATSEAR